MKKLLVLLFAIVIITACLPGCSSDNDVFISCDDFNEQKQDMEADVTLSPGETITVTIYSNPTTGFSWDDTATIERAGVLKQTGHRFIEPGESKPGAPGYQEWTFEALGSGQTTAYVEYSRPWEGGEKGVRTFTLTVVVK